MMTPPSTFVQNPAEVLRVYVGTYGQPNEEQGIYLFEMNTIDGRLAARGLAASIKNPSFMAIHPSLRYLYAVSEAGDFLGDVPGTVAAFAIDGASGKLTLINQQTSGGPGPCFLTVDRSGRTVLVANYGGGSVASLPIATDGFLGEPVSVIRHTGSSVDTSRQKQAHAHSIFLDSSGMLALAPDLGIDKVMLYRLDPATSSLTPHDPPFVDLDPGSGPRHLAFHPSGKFTYVLNELKSTVTQFSHGKTRRTLIPTRTISALPADFIGKSSSSEILVHPSGKFLYASNRGHDSIAIFEIDLATGRLALIGHEMTRGRIPRNFRFDPLGRFLIVANQGSNSLVVFQVHPELGTLTYTGVTADCVAPACVKFLAVA